MPVCDFTKSVPCLESNLRCQMCKRTALTTAPSHMKINRLDCLNYSTNRGWGLKKNFLKRVRSVLWMSIKEACSHKIPDTVIVQAMLVPIYKDCTFCICAAIGITLECMVVHLHGCLMGPNLKSKAVTRYC